MLLSRCSKANSAFFYDTLFPVFSCSSICSLNNGADEVLLAAATHSDPYKMITRVDCETLQDAMHAVSISFTFGNFFKC